MRSSLRWLSFFLLPVIPGAVAVEPTKVQPNNDPNYIALRQARPSGQAYEVTKAKLVRDVSTFTFNSGTLYFLDPVQGVVTGAVFKGAGTFTMHPG